ncbi:hypothetical protein [Tsukamurella strandjordii]|uniref:Uncharacterized protein n=1 Tax=Tsukamurella strandjordii TaxID=147577 RepID=A0AA90NJN2_9ACTN|nr:hypothetical protein [Tsukamurella strandjordii]MDP0399194.1 hypothetical protein [Tsukamurella strandjordii]
MIDVHMTLDGDETRRYALTEPLTTRRVARVESDGDPVFAEDSVTITELTIEIPRQWEHSVTIPAVLVTGSGPDVNANIGAYPTAVPWDEVLDDLGLRLVPGAPPPPPGPVLVGAVPTVDDLPAAPEPLGVYLVRADEVARCYVGGEWREQPWTPECESLFGMSADDVPDLT